MRVALLLAVCGLLSACTVAVAGQGTPPPAASMPTATAQPEPCGAAGAPQSVVHCLVLDVTHFWVGELHVQVGESMVVDPAPRSVPQACRDILGLGTAFYCTANRTVYLTGAFISRSSTAYGPDLPYALAAVVGHEFGHVVQDAVHQPGFEATDLASSRTIEQQADCLLGVWGHDAAARRLLDGGTLKRITQAEYTTVDQLPPPPNLHGYSERATHGTVPQRLAAFDAGLTAGRPATCGLAR
jgi:predicted metalloprotease